MDNTNINDKYDYSLIPDSVRDYISTVETAKLLYRIVFERYGIPLEQSRKVVDIVWEIYFKRLSFDKLENEILGTGLDSGKAKMVSEALKKEIFAPIADYLGAPSGTSIQNNDLVKIGLISAMQKYPALGEKLITTNPIKLKIFPAQVRPSIKNWIADYHHVAGAGSHGSMERADYLYHSDNTKNLSQVDRQKLAMILKSIDENEPVTIDTDKMQIIFSGQESLTRPDENRGTLSPMGAREDAERSSKGSFPSPQDYFKRNTRQDINKDVQFSYPQKMSSETLTPRRVFPPENLNNGFQKSAQDESYRPDRIHHLSEDDSNPAGGNNSEPEPKVRGNVVDLRG